MSTASTSKLRELGFELKYDYRGTDHKYPSMMFERVTSAGYHVEQLIFDTIHGGPWTFEIGLSLFMLNDELNWTTQQRIEFNPASRIFIGSDVGHWIHERPVMDAELCRAVADYITELERERIEGKRREEEE